MARQHERTLARRSALEALYLSEILGVSADAVIEDNLLPDLRDEGLPADMRVASAAAGLDTYACSLVRGVAAHRASIDAAISGCSRNWALDRMPVVDRCVLRIAVYEMRYEDSVPVSVAINEAVELAKEFGGEDESHRFVNGLLGRMAKDLEAEGQGASEEQGAEREASEPDAADDTGEQVAFGGAGEWAAKRGVEVQDEPGGDTFHSAPNGVAGQNKVN